MGKVIRVTQEELAKVSQTMQGLSESYNDIYTQLIQEASTMGTAWEGEDNVAFVSQITGFCEDLKAMAAKILTSSQAIEKQRANYASRQQSNIDQVKKLTN